MIDDDDDDLINPDAAFFDPNLVPLSSEERRERIIQVLREQDEVSVAELIRRSIDQTLGATQTPSPDRRRQKALEIVGAFASGQPGLARAHDDALAEAYQ